MKRSILLTTFTLSALTVASAPSDAASKKIHFQQSRALIDFASVETRVLTAALSAREFDYGLTEKLASSLSTAVAQAKKHVDVTTDLLEESETKLSPKLKELRTALVDAERQLESLSLIHI